MRKTKIVCTNGPATDSREMLSKLMDAGMNVVRLNMSHGSYEEHAARIALVRELRAEKGIPVAIMLDTKGPEVRTKLVKGDKVTLTPGQTFTLAPGSALPHTGAWQFCWKTMLSVKRGVSSTLAPALKAASAASAVRINFFISDASNCQTFKFRNFLLILLV